MAYGLKYRSEFVNAQGHSCRLDLFYKDYSGATIALNSGLRAFVLREFNSDNDFYKPIRPQQAEFEILADVVTLESFLFNDDDSVQVQFSWEGNLYWRGWLIQDDFEESWVDSAHFITLRATEQLSGLNIIAPALPIGSSTPLDFIINAISTTSISNTLDYGIRILNNLFYTSMDDKDILDTNICLDQMYLNNQTFQKTLITFDDYQTILEKINTSFNQTIFQYQGAAYLMRMSEFITYPNTLPGVQFQPLVLPTRISTAEDYKCYIGIDAEIKPIMPEMLRQVERPYKKFQIDYKYEFPPEILCNESFLKGTFISETATQKNYTLDNWTIYKGSRDSPTAASTTKGRQIDYSTDGEPLDNFAFYNIDDTGGNIYTWIQSCDIKLIAGSWIEIDFDTFFNSALGFNDFKVAQVLFIRNDSIQYRYGLSMQGQWILSPDNTFDNAAIPFLTGSQEAGTSRRYFNTNVRSNPVPYNGIVKVLFIARFNELGGAIRQIKNLKFNINTLVNGKNDVKIIGDYDLLTKTENIKQNYQTTSYLDDGENPYWKGVIFDEFGERTGDNWYRMQYQSESFTFKRQKAIAHWLLNRRYRQLITGNFYGITWSSYERPIGLMSRFIFFDDAPTKQFMIVNLQEIDFVSCQWKATLIETYDSTLDAILTDYPPHSFDFLYQE